MTGFASASRVKPTTGCLYCVYKELRRLKAVMRMRSRIQELTRKFREDRDPLLAAAACTHREDRVAFGANYGGFFWIRQTTFSCVSSPLHSIGFSRLTPDGSSSVIRMPGYAVPVLMSWFSSSNKRDLGQSQASTKNLQRPLDSKRVWIIGALKQ
jgi:hypothetical protein